MTAGLADLHGRVATDLRVSLTDRCDLRCSYCMPAEGLAWIPRSSILTDEETARLVRIAVTRLGVQQVRFTGGEPLLRPGLAAIIEQAAALEPRPEISLTTNAVTEECDHDRAGSRRRSLLAAHLRESVMTELNTEAAAGIVALTAVTEHPLDSAAHESAVAHPAAGAVVSFVGTVRNHDQGRPVTRLDYEAHPQAQEVLQTVAREIADDPGVIAVAVSHRTGSLAIGDAAIVAAVSSAHRAEAFAACARLVEEAKARLPVWKHQYFADGTSEWVDCAH
jgi:molybdopterin synthase catalytic subunit